VSIVRRAGVLVAGGAAALVCLVLSLLAGVGLLYAFRGAGWFAAGPRIPDALPLLQLAGFDGQPLVRVLVAWAAAGLVLGFFLARTRPAPRLLAVALFGLLLLLVASDASSALAHNTRFSQVLNDRVPPPGPWLEAGVLALACALPGLTAALPRVLRTGSRARLDDPLARGARP
jgi:hypothetical protein